MKLKLRGLLKRVSDHETVEYKFASSLMEWYVIKQILNSNQENLIKRQKMFAGLMSNQQLEKVENTLNWIWNNKDKIPTIFQWLTNLS